ncbi:carboxypeptidase-like regulatory domain-containing protein [Novipirellula artificiosorum]|uniref:Nickel uptake substrate-specific transmembrane region n=1 Tax=Novipirellula artificiosorum TaxID=2528016 RepID=A0A5C6E058_9BACT|nr:carboxypeptidase-like regulatory domain-containing protein [Novipirellula artificiosorum]TWU41081.1 Nickel uptake substrate-specific transmembrane region [Novipirellula artificiosorum]
MFTVFSTLAAILAFSGVPLSGRVVDQNDQPVDGAVVKISVGRPRTGPALTCPSCYVDCGKFVLTDADGKFHFEGVSSDLFFGLTAGALGYQGALARDVDPLEPDLTLRIAKLDDVDPGETLAGKVVDLQGNAISGAMITVGTTHYLDGSLTGPGRQITPATVTDADGQFALTVRAAIRSTTLKVRVPGFAPQDVVGMQRGRTGQVIQMGPGGSLMGRMLLDGKPVSGMKLGLVQMDRRIGNVVTPDEIVTAADGMFRWDNLPPAADYAIYSQFEQLSDAALAVSIVTVPADGELADLGEIAAQKSHGLKIQIVMSDGAEVPEGSFCYLTRSKAAHSAKEPLSSTSLQSVAFDGLATEVVEIGVRIPNYEIESSDPPSQIDLNGRLQRWSDHDETIVIQMRKRR